MILCPVCNYHYELASAGGPCPRCALRGALVSATEPEPEGDFEFMAELGRGAMGRVSLVRQRSLDRLVALKVIAVGARPVEWLEARLLREARAAAQLQHPYIVAVHEVGHGPDGAFLAMEYCEGGDLRAQLRLNPLAPRAATELVAKLADAIAHAHAAGVLHRDLKPSNILLTAAGEPKISDFGLTASATSSGASEFTQTGEVVGSPSYLAPETLQPGARPTPAVDIYGLGSILYECVTGRPPFTGASSASVLAQIAKTEPAAPRVLNAGIPRDLETITLKCLEKNPSTRYTTAVALRDDLRCFAAGRPIVARPVSMVGRAWRWAQRNPALAASLALAVILLAGITLISTVAALRLDREHLLTSAALVRTTAAEANAREQLRASLIAQARATRFTARSGQRFDALEAIRRAAAIRPGPDARDEAIAALALPDWEVPNSPLKVWSDNVPSNVTPFPDFTAFIREMNIGKFTRRTFPGNDVRWTWAGRGSLSASSTVISPDGRWLAVRLRNDEIHVLDAATGQPLFHLEGRPFAYKSTPGLTAYLTDMAFSDDGTRFAATRPEGGATFHRMPDGAQTGEWKNSELMVAISFSHDGHRLAAGSHGHWASADRDRVSCLVALVDADTGRELLSAEQTSRANFIAWSADDRWVALGTAPIQVCSSDDLLLRNIVPDTTAYAGRFLPDNHRLLLSARVNSTKLWDVDQGRLLLDKADDGRAGIWIGGQPLKQWRDFGSGEFSLSVFHDSPIFSTIRQRNNYDSASSSSDPMDLSPDSRWLVVSDNMGPLIIDLTKPNSIRHLKVGSGSHAFVARFDSTGGNLWIGEVDGPLKRCSLTVDATDQLVIGPMEMIAGHDGFFPTALDRTTGALVLTKYGESNDRATNLGGSVRVLDTHTRQILSEWPFPRVTSATFSPDGKEVLCNGNPLRNQAVEIHEVSSGRLVRKLGESRGKQALWSNDDRFVLAGIGEHAVGLWQTKTWTQTPALPFNFQFLYSACAFSPDSRTLAIKDERALVLLRTDSLGVLARLEIPDGLNYLVGLRFTADGRRLIAVHKDCQVDVWDLGALRLELRQLGLDWKD